MKFRWDRKYLYWGMTAAIVLCTVILFYYCVFHLSSITKYFKMVAAVCQPIIIGFVLAYLLNPLLHFIEIKLMYPTFYRIFKKKAGLLSRVFGIIITLFLFILMLFFLFSLVIPQIAESIKQIILEMDTYYENIISLLSKTMEDNPQIVTFLEGQIGSLTTFVKDFGKNYIMPQLNQFAGIITNGVIGAVLITKDIFVGFIIAVYVMAYKNKLFAQCKKLTVAFFSPKAANRILRITRQANSIFSGFISGKILDSIIIGFLCFFGMTLFKIPFPMLISVIIGVTNIIPFFGPFFGAIPSILLLIIVDPIQAVYFAIFVLVLQQFDGNVLGPKILGDSTGLSSFWVIISIIISGGLFGVVGMLVGVPVFALLYTLIHEIVNVSLEKKEVSALTEDYQRMESIDPVTKKLIQRPIYPMEEGMTSFFRKKTWKAIFQKKKKE